MGNQFSTNSNEPIDIDDISKPKSSYEIIDFIATHFILTADFVSLTRLNSNKEYCDNLVILTSDIINRYFTDLEITYLAQRTKNGIVIDEEKKDKIIFFDRDYLKKIDIQNAVKKKRMCQSIAKFYIKIAHVFATIVRTINPVYVYKDNEGNIVRANLYEKHNIPEGVPREIFKMNICDMRIKALQGNHDYSKLGAGDPITIGPNICSMNIDDSGKVKTLIEEPGIPELEHLYYDDGYNYETGKFEKMSEDAVIQYNNDLKTFYEAFTGNKPDETIRKFSDVRLRDFGKSEECSGNIPEINGNLNDELFAKYADNLRHMIDNANKNQDKLTDIINKLFTYIEDPQTHKKVVRINPQLTEAGLQKVVVETRTLVVNMYLTCENDFEEGVKIYKAIAAQRFIKRTEGETKSLTRDFQQLSDAKQEKPGYKKFENNLDDEDTDDEDTDDDDIDDEDTGDDNTGDNDIDDKNIANKDTYDEDVYNPNLDKYNRDKKINIAI
jgi:hypothetical protein